MEGKITLTLTDRKGVIAPGALEERMAQAAPLLEKAVTGDPVYRDFLGWRMVDESAGPERVAYLQEQAARVRADADAFVVIGIGGSNQSSRAAIKALRPEGGPAILWAGNTISAAEMARTLEELEALGLTVPGTVKLMWELRQRGLDVPLSTLTVDECANALAAHFAGK